MDALILSCGTGGGHDAAGAAAAMALSARGHRVRTLNPYTLKGGKVADAVNNAYIHLVQRAPAAFGMAYRLGNAYRRLPFPSPVYQINRQMEPALERFLSEDHFDTIVVTHLFPAEILTNMRRRGRPVPRTYFIATDYTCIPFTEETDCDRYIIPARQLTEEFVGRGIPAERIRPLGIPVRPAFSLTEDRDAVRARLGLAPDRKYILAAGGSMGAGQLAQVTGLLLERYGPSAGVIAVCGSNQALYREMQEAYGQRCTVLGFTDQMADYMKACDLFLSKPGGLSSTEAAVVGTALVHITPIPGCESLNMAFFQRNGMCLAADAPKTELADACDELLDPDRRAQMIAAQRRVIPADAAGALCRLIESEI